jgi:hypothetical protein
MLNRVTVTGADDTIDPQAIIELSTKYPFAEFGILASVAQDGVQRFPSIAWRRRLAMGVQKHKAETGKLVPLSGHLCWQLVRDVYMGDWSSTINHLWPLSECLFRYQLNTHGITHEFDPLGMTLGIGVMLRKGFNVIIQKDNANEPALQVVIAMNGHRSAGTVDVLYDLSHGAGILPTSWPVPIPATYCGYSGGLSAENLKAQLQLLDSFIPDRVPYWVDAETHLRTGPAHDDKFDLAKVDEFLAIAARHIEKYAK